MIYFIEQLPVELVGTNVLSYLSMKDIVMLERTCGSKKSHQVFIDVMPYFSHVDLSSLNYTTSTIINWFKNRRCKINNMNILLFSDNPVLQIKDFQVDYVELRIDQYVGMETLQTFLEINILSKVKSIYVEGNQNKDVMEQLSACTENVKTLHLRNSDNCMDWLTVDILTRWKLNAITFTRSQITTKLILLIVTKCTELTSIKLYQDDFDLTSNNINDLIVMVITKSCLKLETLVISSNNITWISLLYISKFQLTLKELDIPRIPNIPTAAIAEECSHAL